MVRRLPVIQSDFTDGPPRPAWRWILLGAGLSLCLWAASASVVLPATARMSAAADAGPVAAAVAALSTFGLAVAVGAYLVGRHGPREQSRLGLGVGAAASAVAWVIALSLGAPAGLAAQLLSLLILTAVGVVSGWAAGHLGRRRAGSVASGAPKR